MVKHSPGPWERSYSEIYDCDDKLIAEVFDAWTGKEEADLQLISAAPELLESLKTCVDVLEGMDPGCVYLPNARAVIARAGG